MEMSNGKSAEHNGNLVKRRNVLGTIGGGAIGLSLCGSSRAKAASSGLIEIDYALRREELGDSSSPLTTRTKQVSRDWHDSLIHAQRARRQGDFESQRFVREVTLTPPKHGGSGPRLNVGVLRNPDGEVEPDTLSTQEALERIPDNIGGVPINAFSTGDFQLGCYETDYGEDVPTGAEMEVGYDNTHCTMGAPLHQDGERYFSTCQHIFYGDNPGSRKLYNQDEDAAIGDVREAFCQDDFVTANPINGHTPSMHIGDPNGGLTTDVIVEQFTKKALQDMIAADEYLTKRGIMTCKTSGQIGAANGYFKWTGGEGCDERCHQVKWGGDNDFDDGDSGSVAYQKFDQGQVGVAGVCNGRDPNPFASYKVFGTAAWHITDEWQYTYV